MTDIEVMLYVKKYFISRVLKDGKCFITYADCNMISFDEYSNMVDEFIEKNVITESDTNIYSETKKTRTYYQLLCRISSSLSKNSIYYSESYINAISNESSKQVTRGQYMMLKIRYNENDNLIAPVYRMMFYKSYSGYIAFGSITISDGTKGYYIVHDDSNPAIPIMFTREKPDILQYGVFITDDVIMEEDMLIRDYDNKVFCKNTRKTFIICDREYPEFPPSNLYKDNITFVMPGRSTKFCINPTNPKVIYDTVFSLILNKNAKKCRYVMELTRI